MQIRRQEIMTGLLVVATAGLFTFIVIRLGAPGVFSPLKTFYILFDNASGMKPGASVLLAGRRIGQVTKLNSPVPMDQRPPGYKNYEVLVTVQVSASAEVYKKVDVRMVQPSLLADNVIDFTSGQPDSGLAPDDTTFIGQRDAGIAESVSKALAEIGPIAKAAESALAEVKDTAENLKRITSKGSEFDLAMTGFRNLGDNLAEMSREGGPLRKSLSNFQKLTAQLEDIVTRLNADNAVGDTLESFQAAAKRFEGLGDNLEGVAVTLNNTINGLDPQLQEILANTGQMTDTLKRQPWRLIWPVTKNYPPENPPEETAAAFNVTRPDAAWRRSAAGRP